MNQLFREMTGAVADVIANGVLPWDADVDYLQHAIVRSGTVLYRATVATGPDTSNATDPAASGQTVWAEVSGTTGAPSAPSAPQAVGPASGELDWFWDCPLDGGAKVTSFNVRYRVAGTAAWQPDATGDSVTTARYALTGLTNGTAIEAQVQAVNSVGTSPWSSTGSATPSGTVPGGGATLALRAEAGDGEVDLDWLEPDDGGVTITSYTVQWRTGNQGYSTGRQATATGTTHTVSSLTNDTEYFFRVRAVNGEGNGAWSGDASATPVAVIVPPTPPADTAPDAPDAPTGESLGADAILWQWNIPDDDGGQPIESYDFQWREDGNNWSGNLSAGITAGCVKGGWADGGDGLRVARSGDQQRGLGIMVGYQCAGDRGGSFDRRMDQYADLRASGADDRQRRRGLQEQAGHWAAGDGAQSRDGFERDVLGAADQNGEHHAAGHHRAGHEYRGHRGHRYLKGGDGCGCAGGRRCAVSDVRLHHSAHGGS